MGEGGRTENTTLHLVPQTGWLGLRFLGEAKEVGFKKVSSGGGGSTEILRPESERLSTAYTQGK